MPSGPCIIKLLEENEERVSFVSMLVVGKAVVITRT